MLFLKHSFFPFPTVSLSRSIISVQFTIICPVSCKHAVSLTVSAGHHHIYGWDWTVRKSGKSSSFIVCPSYIIHVMDLCSDSRSPLEGSKLQPPTDPGSWRSDTCCQNPRVSFPTGGWDIFRLEQQRWRSCRSALAQVLSPSVYFLSQDLIGGVWADMTSTESSNPHSSV